MLARLLSLSGQAATIALLNAVAAALLAFHVVFTDTQLASIDVVVNAILAFLALLLGQQAAKASAKKAAASGGA